MPSIGLHAPANVSPYCTSQDLARSCVEVTTLTTEVEQLRREKRDLLGEVEGHKLTVSSGRVGQSNVQCSTQVT